MRINKEKRIGKVLFIVEGSKAEFSILRRIFCNILGYSYIERNRNRPDFFKKDNDPFSQVAVINTRESNIRDISENRDFLDALYEELLNKYRFPKDEAAIYYLFDRDPKSNTDPELIKEYILNLANPYDNDGNYENGQLLLSYPSIESYMISNFFNNINNISFNLGKEVKKYMASNPSIQLNKMSEGTIINAAKEFLNYLMAEQIVFDIDNFKAASYTIFTRQEQSYLAHNGFRLFSMLTLAFLQMGIIEI